MPGTRKKGGATERPSDRTASGPAPLESVGDWHLPTELRRFFKTRTAQSLQIRGAPGTGKTTLALSLLAGLPIPGFYVSTRVNYAELQEHYPWLSDVLPEDHVVDAEGLWTGPEARQDYAALIRQFTELVPENPAFGELERFLTLPTGVQEVFSRIPPGGRSALVIDSWDGLIEPYLGHPSVEPTAAHRLRVENALISVLQGANVHTVLVRETPAFTNLEYLVHGVVELRREDLQGMVVREMIFHKLRGVPLQSSSVLYSLDGARFTAVPRSYPQSDPAREEHFELRENPPDGGLSWGLLELDRVLGPLRAGEPVLFEVDSAVDRTALGPVSFHAFAQAIRSGWDVSVLPSTGLPVTTILRGLEPMVDRAQVLERLSTFAIPPVIAPGAPTPPATRQLVEQIKESFTNRSLVRLSLVSLESAFGSSAEYLEAIHAIGSRMRERGGILLMVGMTGAPGLAEIGHYAPVHVKAMLANRTMLLYGIRPNSPAVALLVDGRRNGYPGVRLIPIR